MNPLGKTIGKGKETVAMLPYLDRNQVNIWILIWVLTLLAE